MKVYYVYILTNKHHTVLYRCYKRFKQTDVATSKKIIKGFTQKYNIENLVFYEIFDFIEMAIAREKQIKGYSREKKNTLINSFNPEWINLYSNEKIEIPNKARGTLNKGIPPSSE